MVDGSERTNGVGVQMESSSGEAEKGKEMPWVKGEQEEAPEEGLVSGKMVLLTWEG